MKAMLIAILLVAGVCSAIEPLDRIPLQIPDGATKIDANRISVPLAHQAKKASLLFKKLAGESAFCEVRPEQASELAGSQYTEIAGEKTILVKWSFLKPVDEKGVDLVHGHAPTIHIKDDTLYVASSGIDIGDVAEVVEGVLIVQVPKLPQEIVHKLARTGW